MATIKYISKTSFNSLPAKEEVELEESDKVAPTGFLELE